MFPKPSVLNHLATLPRAIKVFAGCNGINFLISRSTASWPLEPPSDQEGWRYERLQQAGKNASGQTHYLSLSGFEVYGTVVAAVEEPLG